MTAIHEQETIRMPSIHGGQLYEPILTQGRIVFPTADGDNFVEGLIPTPNVNGWIHINDHLRDPMTGERLNFLVSFVVNRGLNRLGEYQFEVWDLNTKTGDLMRIGCDGASNRIATSRVSHGLGAHIQSLREGEIVSTLMGDGRRVDGMFTGEILFYKLPSQ